MGAACSAEGAHGRAEACSLQASASLSLSRAVIRRSASAIACEGGSASLTAVLAPGASVDTDRYSSAAR